jgi:hypothetical protein
MVDRHTSRPVWSPTLASSTQLEPLNQVVRLVTEIIDAIGAPSDQPRPNPAFESTPSPVTRRRLPSARIVPRWRTRC